MELEEDVLALLWLSAGRGGSATGFWQNETVSLLLELRKSLVQRRYEPSPKPRLVRNAVLSLKEDDLALGSRGSSATLRLMGERERLTEVIMSQSLQKTGAWFSKAVRRNDELSPPRLL